MSDWIDVNAHLHTPFSFSAFRDIDDALDRAAAEKVGVVGINDFYSLDGYGPWAAGCAARGLYPLFNIEFISLNSEDQEAGLRVNDPSNPGRTYLSGKGLAFPAHLPAEGQRILSRVRAASNAQVAQMCSRLNAYLQQVGAGISLDFDTMCKQLTCGLVRERHLAKALRLAVQDRPDAGERYARILGRPLKADLSDVAAIENELRSALLKSGGPAFVPEAPDAFLPMEVVCDWIRSAGGIPTYPFLGDDAQGHFTPFEEDLQHAADTLRRRGIHSVEFIPSRNTAAVLERYSDFLEEEGFIVTFGSEHNTPAMEPLRRHTRGTNALNDRLRAVNYRGACAIAAHQAGLDSPAAAEELIRKTVLV